MKYVPNQITRLDDLTAALGVANVFIGQGNSLQNHDGYAEALTEGEVLDAADKQESNAATARGVRRFFQLAGLISPEWTALTAEGQEILNAAENTALRNALWRNAMLRFQVDDQGDGNWSHPYRILLNLVTDRPGIETRKLLLVLEAVDDSAEEYARILDLADHSIEEIMAQLNISEASARNAVKILPSIAKQLNDIKNVPKYAIPINHSSQTEDSANLDSSETTEPTIPIPIAPANIAPIPNFGNNPPATPDQAAALAVLKQRTIEHQNAVVSLATILSNHGYAVHATPYDCLAFKEGTGGLLIEMKTLNGTRADERRQSEKALGQLKGYDYFSVHSSMKIPKLVQVAAFTATPAQKTNKFLGKNMVHSVWHENQGWRVADFEGNIENFSPDALLDA